MPNPLVPLAALLALSAVPAAPLLQEDDYAPPQTEFPVDFSFGENLRPYRGVDRLEELRGAPVFVVYWWHESDAAREVLRDVLARLAPYAEDVEVLLCESSPASAREHDAFLFELGVFSTRAHAFRGEPVPRTWHEFQGFLLDAAGRVSWWGRLEDPWEGALERRIAEVSEHADVTHADVRKGWERFRSGDWKGAHRIGSTARKKGLRRVERGETPPAGELDLLTQGELLVLAVEERHLALCERAERLLRAGRAAAAADLREFVKDRGKLGAKRCAEAEEALDDRLRDREVQRQIRAERELEEILERARGDLRNGGALAEEAGALRAFLDEYGDGPPAARARDLLELVD